MSNFIRITLLCALCFPAAAQFNQQGGKLTGTGESGNSQMGFSMALSGDGNTAIAGGPYDNSNAGAAWIFVRTNGVWSQQGNKLVGTGATGNARQGWSVAISSDGNTVLMGGELDNSGLGATWVFTRSNGAWTQQGNKLVGSGAVGNAAQGFAVALSGDGNTALIGGSGDNGSTGAAWVFTRSNGAWSQVGNKLVGTGPSGAALQGSAVALSSDASTALIAGPYDAAQVGAVWVFTQSNGAWSQQGSKLLGSGAVGGAAQGWSVALASDGNTALIGGDLDNDWIGAAWVFTRSAGVWTQQGSKLVGTNAVGQAYQATSVALSSDGNTALLGGPFDNGIAGAGWVFTRFDGVWSQQGSKLVGDNTTGAWQGWSVGLSADGNTEMLGGKADNSNAGAAWVFTRTCQASVPLISQSSAPWGGATYDHSAGDTIAARGSGLTSLAMALNYMALDFSVGQAWDPGSLNTLLDSSGAYTPAPASSVIWQVATNATNTVNGATPLLFDSLGGWVNSDTSLTAAFNTVEEALCASTPLPVIVAVRSPKTNRFPGHVVLVTGEVINSDATKALIINDPAYTTSVIGTNETSGATGYTNPTTGAPEFWTRGAVHDPTNLSGLSASVNAVVDLMVTDPNSLQSGYSTGSATPQQNIPNSGAGIDEIDNDVSGAAASPVQTVMIQTPASGTFQIALTGVTPGPYTLEIEAQAANGAMQQFSAAGMSMAGVTNTYAMSFVSGNLSFLTINGSAPSACDIDYEGTTGVADVQSEINEALGAASAVTDLNKDGMVSVIDVQIVLNSALGYGCA